jgi:hypothetical protein
MKSVFAFFACMILLLSTPLAAQVRVLSENMEFNGKLGDVHRKSLIIQNESKESKEFQLKFIRGNIGSSQTIKVCIGQRCYDPKKEFSKIKLTLGPNEIYTDLYLEFNLGIAETKGNFDLHFVNPVNARDVFVVEAVYSVQNVSAEEISSNDVTMGNIFPNPSNRIAQINYKLKNPSANASINIISFIGNPVAEYVLDPQQTSLVINVADFQPGTYFYTLFVNNKNIVTRKFVVKK